MRILMIVQLPNEPANTLIRDGRMGAVLGRVLEEVKPEAIYFSEREGLRTIFLVARTDDDSGYPALAEPWWLAFDARVEAHVCMLPADLEGAGLDAIGARWK